MIAVLGTLPFLATLWLLVVLGTAVLEESADKIVAALKGEGMNQPTSVSQAARIRARPPVRTAMCANEPWRAAA